MKAIETKDRTSYHYRFGSAEFNEARFELRVAGIVVEAEPKALEVLAVLLRHAGEVITKEELLAQVWAGRITVEKVLPNAVNKLRRALGEANAAFISTQARVGYRLDGVVQRTAVGQQLYSRLSLAARQPVPGRENFLLTEQFSNHRGGEVWLAIHQKTHERRVYKFAVDSDRLRSIKREATLARVLQECLPEAERSPFVELIDWNFEQAPYFLECHYGGQSLHKWAETELAARSVDQRIELFLQIADAVALAHSVGVLHKDLKPANVLVESRGERAGSHESRGERAGSHESRGERAGNHESRGERAGNHESRSERDSEPGGLHLRLTDFGSGKLLDADLLAQLKITRLGMTVTHNFAGDSSDGTPGYLAPELYTGALPTVQSDVFALGVMLYQLLSGKLNQPMAPGWEQDVTDELLREDVQRATDGDVSRRLNSASELARRLRARDERRAASQAQKLLAQQAALTSDELARARARKPFVIATLLAMGLGLLSAIWLQRQAVEARNQSQQALARASALNLFINEDLIGAANPLVLAKGQSAELKDLLLAARTRISDRYQAQPATEATLRGSLAELFQTVDLWPEAEAEATQALALLNRVAGKRSAEAIKLQALLTRILARQAKLQPAEQAISALEALLPPSAERSSEQQYLLASASSAYFNARGDFKKTQASLEQSISALKSWNPGNTALLDSLRLELIGVLSRNSLYAEAQTLGEALIAEAAARPNDNGLIVALAKVQVGRSLSYQGDPLGAEKLMLEADPIIAAQLGETHSRRLSVQSELMAVAFRASDYQKALPYAEQVYQSWKRKLGPTDSRTLTSLGNWGRTYYEIADYPNAKLRLREAYSAIVAEQSEAAPQAQDLAFMLALTEIAIGDLNAAEQLLATLNAETLESFRGHGLWREAILGVRGLLLNARGARADALPLLRESYGAVKPEAGEEPDRFAQVLQQRLSEYSSSGTSK